MGGLLGRRALINQICSGGAGLMPELKHDQEVRGRRADKRREERRKIESQTSNSLPLLRLPLSLSSSLCVLFASLWGGCLERCTHE